ncbi:MAG TPA: hypothetical protein VK707_07230 [Solirubrobacteraceae bacterium]|nr:hypothetical protein [Solirubrobacteraceae bacterium]
MNTSTSSSSPSPRQLRYLRDLATQTGTSFTNPATRAQASSEIDRLKKLKSGASRLPLDFVDDDAEQALRYATEVRSEEVSGHGVSATWANASEPSERPSQPRVGERTELARYRISEGERVLYGQRVDGRVRVTDRPAVVGGRSYLVQSGVEVDGLDALKALVADYLEQADRFDRVPMATSAVRQSEYLAEA